MNEDEQFRTILRFMEDLNGDVSGRMGIDPELDDQLKLLARGALDEERRTKLLTEIARDNAAISRLARYISE